jgi:hypothetical protein
VCFRASDGSTGLPGSEALGNGWGMAPEAPASGSAPLLGPYTQPIFPLCVEAAFHVIRACDGQATEHVVARIDAAAGGVSLASRRHEDRQDEEADEDEGDGADAP